MGTRELILLALLIALAAIYFYSGFLRRGYRSGRAQYAFCMLAIVLIPLTASVLWLQLTATVRLSKTGIVPHPAIVESIGILSGLGEQPIWMFEIDATGDSVTAFYRDENNRRGWVLTTDTLPMMILKRDGEKMTISFNTDWGGSKITYMLGGAKK